jgi:uncharacterized membrane protein YraQ (UPF0718 family)
VSFILADLLIIPILVIYRRYYGRRMAWFIFGIFYASMVAAGYVIEFAFQPLGPAPTTRHANIGQTAPTWNYTTWLNIVFLSLAAAPLPVLHHRWPSKDGRRPRRHGRLRGLRSAALS